MIIRSIETDPYLNLAWEEFFLTNNDNNNLNLKLEKALYILFIWQSNNSIIIGKNQNPWKEANINLIEKDGFSLARRLSGGGTVYHDLGNINFSLIQKRQYIKDNLLSDIIIAAIASFGLKVEKNISSSSTASLIINNYKISGSASCFKANNSLQHCTLLINADFKAMDKYLTQPLYNNFITKAIPSKKANVANLSFFSKDINLENIIERVAYYFNLKLGLKDNITNPATIEFNKIILLKQKYASWEWNFGLTPDFAFKIKDKTQKLDLSLNIKKGIVASISSPVLLDKKFNSLINNKFNIKLTIS